MERLTDLLNVFNSKQKKGVNFIYNQQYFSDAHTAYQSQMKTKELSRAKSRSNSSSKSPSKSNIANKSTGGNNNASSTGSVNPSLRASPIQISPSKISQYMVSLDSSVLQNLFSFSVLDTFNKCFSASNEKNVYNTTLLLSDYKTRDMMLRETVKPIVSSNEISVFNAKTKRITKVQLKLDKQKHGYDKFPQGIRHIFIDDQLYITGGVDMQGKEISTVLSVDCKSFKVEVEKQLMVPRSYHSIDYLDNYDCLIAVGGEENNTCELFDLFTKKWSRLPDLTYWRSNCNIYYDHVTSDIYVLFGICSTIKEANCLHSDSIEVLELRDIKSGWMKIDYYKSVDFNLTMNYCTVLPLTRDRLLVYGAANARMKKKCFGLFNTKTSEIVRITEPIMEEIRNEEIKIKKEEERIKGEK